MFLLGWNYSLNMPICPHTQIVHLKRFNFVNNKWVKSQKVVNFPYKDFDPTPYLASVPQETILRHRELLEHQALHATVDPLSPAVVAENGDDDAEDADDADADDGNATEHTDTIRTSIRQPAAAAAGAAAATATPSAAVEPAPAVPAASRRKSVCSPTRSAAGTQSARRKRLVSTSLTQTPVIDGEFNDFHKHRLVDGQDPYDLNYQLYAVVVSSISI